MTDLERKAATWAEKARVAASRALEAAERRDDAICQLLEEGATLRHVAELVGLSHVAVAKIRDHH